MEISDSAYTDAIRLGEAIQDATGRVVSARYDRRTRRVCVELDNGLGVSIPARSLEGLSDAAPADLAVIEVSPSGLGLHWPRLDADVYLPGLLSGVFGSPAWAARMIGQNGGRATSAGKAAAARENGKRGGRPRKSAA